MKNPPRLSIAHSSLAAAIALGLCAPAFVHAADPAPAHTASPAPAKDDKKDEKKEPVKAPPAGKADGKKEKGPDGATAGPGGRANEPMVAFSTSQIEEALQLLQDIDPDLATKISELRGKNPERVAAVLFQHIPRLAPLVALKKNDPELFKLKIEDMKLDRETHEAVKLLKASKDEARTKELRAKILDGVTRQFYVRQEIREHELATLEKRVGELRDQIEARKDAQKKLIQDRITQLTGKEETAEW